MSDLPATTSPTPSPGALGPPPRRGLLRQAALYPEQYTWFVFVSSLDVLFTWLILHAGGTEVNGVADWLIRRYQLPGLAGFKFCCVVLVVLICEIVGRQRPETGAKLARWAVVLAAFPVVVGAFHLYQISLGVRGVGGTIPVDPNGLPVSVEWGGATS